MNNPLHIIILAAGDGTRMKSCLPKVLQPVAARPMLSHVIRTSQALEPEGIHVVHNPDALEALQTAVPAAVSWVPQTERLGTGHAVMAAMHDVPEDARVLVLYGDTPLVPVDELKALTASPLEDLAVLTMILDDPTGYGRIERDEDGAITGVVEQKDADTGQLAITEVNSGIVTAPAASLARWLEGLGTDNSQAEYYLTDIFGLAHAEGSRISNVEAADPRLLEGANDRIQLAALNRWHRETTAAALMLGGVSIADPTRIELRGDIEAGKDVMLDVGVVLEGRIVLGEATVIGPGCVLKNVELAAGTRVHAYSVLEGVKTTGACDIGPFARLRPGTELAVNSRVGNFVEMKNSLLGDGSKASHLSYVGDSRVGKGVNIGAGTITCNYDGVNKHQTIIEDGAFIGSDSQLVAPVTVGKDATVGAGTTLTRDAPPGQLTVSRSRQMSLKNWKRPPKIK